MRIAFVVACVTLCLSAVVVFAQPTAYVPAEPLDRATLNQLGLTPDQQKEIKRIITRTNSALQVPIYIVPPYYGDLDSPPSFVPIDEAIAFRECQLRTEYNRLHPNPVAVQWYLHEIDKLKQTRQDVLALEYCAVYEILTPQQRQILNTQGGVLW